MPQYLTRLKRGLNGSCVYLFEAPTLEKAYLRARGLARDRGEGWRPTASNVAGRFRLKAGEIVENADLQQAIGWTDVIAGAPDIEPLDAESRLAILNLALTGLRLMETAKLRHFGKHLVHTALWCWTADGLVCGEYQRDAVKFDISVLPHTTAAARTANRKQLRHEHAIPRKVIVQHLSRCHETWSTIDDSTGRHEIEAVIAKCPPVVVTRSEDDVLAVKFRSRMPDGWKFGDSPLARYEQAGVIADDTHLVFPANGFWSPSGDYRMK